MLKIIAILIVSVFVILIGIAVRSDYKELHKFRKEKNLLREKYISNKTTPS